MFEGNSALGFVAVLAIVLFFTKTLGLVFRHFGLPEVLGFIIAGILIGPAVFGEPFGSSGVALIGFEGESYRSLIVLPRSEGLTSVFGGNFSYGNGLDIFSKIGVLLLMFSAGLETNLEEIKKTGVAAVLMAFAGVAVPLLFGFLISLPFGNIGLGFADSTRIFRALFVGTILTATSVAITVSVLKELGKFNTKLGTTIVSAAIIDDVIGIVLLSVVTGIAKSGVAGENLTGFEWFKSTIWGTVIMIIAFFAFAIAVGFVVSKFFKWMDKRYPGTHRIPVFALVICFGYSWIAEEIFGVADITGAFLAGVVISTDVRGSKYADKNVEVDTFTVFAPCFFANIGISNIRFAGLNPAVLLFAVLAVILGLAGKVIGCGAVCRGFKYSWRESAIGGVGMMARGEVALIVTATVTNTAILGANALPQEFMIMTVLLILASSILTPIMLKVLYKHEKQLPLTPPDGDKALTEGE